MLIAGVDEVGRGPLAGSVVTAAVILREPVPEVTDSKKLSHKKRVEIAKLIKSKALSYAYGRAEHYEIDKLNIHHATLLAMKRAIDGLSVKPDKILVDGLYAPDIDGVDTYSIVKGDLLVMEISAASILAKVHRDEEMIVMDGTFPGYGFADHKGYPTAKHRQAIVKLGACPIHRRSFSLPDNDS